MTRSASLTELCVEREREREREGMEITSTYWSIGRE